MLMIFALTWGKDIEILPATDETWDWVKRKKKKLGPDTDIIYWDNALLCPFRLDPAYHELSEEEVVEFMNTQVWPKLVEEGRITMKNGRPVRVRKNIEQPQTGGVTITKALREAFGEVDHSR
jgi:hypothetical protein